LRRVRSAELWVIPSRPGQAPPPAHYAPRDGISGGPRGTVSQRAMRCNARVAFCPLLSDIKNRDPERSAASGAKWPFIRKQHPVPDKTTPTLVTYSIPQHADRPSRRHADAKLSLEPFPFRLNRNGGSTSLFDAFSSREPVATPDQVRGGLSLENALANTNRRHLPFLSR
jgi:hypothetical protein